MDTTISAQLHQLAAQLRHPTSTNRGTVNRIAEQLRDIAARNPVALPVVDPALDDLRHWRRLDPDQLRDENLADAWNLACGVHEDRRRARVQQDEQDDEPLLADILPWLNHCHDTDAGGNCRDKRCGFNSDIAYDRDVERYATGPGAS